MKKNLSHKKFLLIIFFTNIILSLSSQSTRAQAGMWTWINGDSIPNSLPVFGTQGIPSALNHPAGLYELSEWKDLQGNFWVYGGMSPNYCDMWMYDPLTNEWTWIKGTGATGLAPVYGTQGVANANNTPGQRYYGSITWTDSSGGLWLFGGADYRNDLWKYDISTNMWTWMSGNTTGNPPAVWGTQGVPSVLNIPAGRQESASGWADGNNCLWLFGGRTQSSDFVDDLWRYNIITSEWTWMLGSQTINPPVNFGTQGTSSPLNTPGGRITYTKFYDTSGNFWIFGGANGSSVITRNDYWKYAPLINEWTWCYGTTAAGDNGTYTQQCTFNTSDVPGGRWEQRASTTDNCGKFWMFGGQNIGVGCMNDLTLFDPQQNKLNWLSGSNSNVNGIFGTKGVASSINVPPSKIGGVAWWGTDNRYYMFGGGKSAGGSCYSDMWVYTPDSSCTLPCNISVVTAFNAPNQLCPGTCTDFINLSQNASSYQWSFPGANPSTSTDINPVGICYNTPGNYDVELIASNSTSTDTLLLTNFITVFPAPSPQGITQSGDTLFANPGANSYQWYYNSTIIIGATDYFYVATTSGNYNVVATDGNGCEVEAVIFDVVASTLSPTVSVGEGIRIYPNPVSAELGVWSKEIGVTAVAISIYNVLGNKIYTTLQKAKSQQQIAIIDVRNFSTGIYFLEISFSEKFYRFKFVKE